MHGYACWGLSEFANPGLILGLHPSNKRCRYKVLGTNLESALQSVITSSRGQWVTCYHSAVSHIILAKKLRSRYEHKNYQENFLVKR